MTQAIPLSALNLFPYRLTSHLLTFSVYQGGGDINCKIEFDLICYYPISLSHVLGIVSHQHGNKSIGCQDGYFYPRYYPHLAWYEYGNNMKPRVQVRVRIWARNIGMSAGLGEHYPHLNPAGVMLSCSRVLYLGNASTFTPLGHEFSFCTGG